MAVLSHAKNILALNDIDSFIKGEHSASMGARFGISNIFHELWLSDDADYDRALAIIEKKIELPLKKSPWVCENCNEENDGSFELCWNCEHVHQVN